MHAPRMDIGWMHRASTSMHDASTSMHTTYITIHRPENICMHLAWTCTHDASTGAGSPYRHWTAEKFPLVLAQLHTQTTHME